MTALAQQLVPDVSGTMPGQRVFVVFVQDHRFGRVRATDRAAGFSLGRFRSAKYAGKDGPAKTKHQTVGKEIGGNGPAKAKGLVRVEHKYRSEPKKPEWCLGEPNKNDDANNERQHLSAKFLHHRNELVRVTNSRSCFARKCRCGGQKDQQHG